MSHCDLVDSSIRIENHISSFFIKTLCDYEPCVDKSLPGKGLKFKSGDLFLVLNANDCHWWQAIHIKRNIFLSSNGITSAAELNLSRDRGLIPSFKRIKNKSKFQNRHVEFEDKAIVIGPTGKLLSEMIGTAECSSFDLKRLKKINSNRLSVDKSFCRPEGPNTLTNPYEIIELRNIKTPRPIVIIGPGKDEVYHYLLSEYPEKFNIPIPHTTRPPRSDEKDGVDYHFVKNREELENANNSHKYIDISRFKGNLYANSIESVRESIGQKKHALLDISHIGIEKLRCANIYPICILVMSSSLQEGDNQDNFDTQSTRDYTLKLEKDFSVLFDVIISPSYVSELKDKVLQLINTYQQSPTWIAACDQSSLTDSSSLS